MLGVRKTQKEATTQLYRRSDHLYLQLVDQYVRMARRSTAERQTVNSWLYWKAKFSGGYEVALPQPYAGGYSGRRLLAPQEPAGRHAGLWWAVGGPECHRPGRLDRLSL